MSAKGDARPERQSSWPSEPSDVQLGAGARARNYCRVTFAGFLLLHLGWQAYRARTDDSIPEAGLEAAPWFVAALLLAVWLPFAVFAGRELSRSRSRRNLPTLGRERALASVEPLALLVVLVFAVAHGLQFAWPLLTGALTASDLRPELIATLSGTERGIPVQATAYLWAVGASSFYAVRQSRKTLLVSRPALARGALALGVLGYLLGSYAVIRCASGAILP